MKNMLSVDVEDWFMDIDITHWNEYEDRIVQSTRRVLSLFSDVTATFFIVGYVAEKHPELITEILDAGHEIGTHGYSHKPLTHQSPSDFEDELSRSIEVIESTTGKRIRGHRAPYFTVQRGTEWSIDIMKSYGLDYDSSVFPLKTPLYGLPGAPLSPYHISSEDLCANNNCGFLEIPLTIYPNPIMNVPVAGGFYLRVLPYKFLNYAIKSINRNNRSAIIYFHPWELDVSQPREKALKWIHYYALSSTEGKLKQLLKDFEFISIQEWINNV